MSRLLRRYRAGRHRPASVPPTVRYAPGRASLGGYPTPIDPWAGSGYVFHWSEA